MVKQQITALTADLTDNDIDDNNNTNTLNNITDNMSVNVSHVILNFLVLFSFFH